MNIKFTVVKTDNTDAPGHISNRVFNTGISNAGLARLIATKNHSSPEIIKAYRWLDWDLLLTDDDDDEYSLIWHNPHIYQAMPIVCYLHAIGASMRGTDWLVKTKPWFTHLEAAKIAVTTETWVSSWHHKSLIHSTLNQYFTEEVASSLIRKVRVVTQGLDLDWRIKPKEVSKRLAICFPHRGDYDKGTDIFIGYAKEISHRLSGRFTIVCHQVVANMLRKAGVVCTLQEFGYVSRKDYLGMLSICDYIMSTSRHENFGLAILEGAAMGARPIVPDSLAYPEVIPDEYRYRTFEELFAILTRDNPKPDLSFVEEHFWKFRFKDWHNLLTETYEKFYSQSSPMEDTSKAVKSLMNSDKLADENFLRGGITNLKDWGFIRNKVRKLYLATTR